MAFIYLKHNKFEWRKWHLIRVLTYFFLQNQNKITSNFSFWDTCQIQIFMNDIFSCESSCRLLACMSLDKSGTDGESRKNFKNSSLFTGQLYVYQECQIWIFLSGRCRQVVAFHRWSLNSYLWEFWTESECQIEEAANFEREPDFRLLEQVSSLADTQLTKPTLKKLKEILIKSSVF